MRKIVTLGKSHLVNKIRINKLKFSFRGFSEKVDTSVIKEKDNFCFTKKSILDEEIQNRENELEKEGINDINFQSSQKIVGDVNINVINPVRVQNENSASVSENKKRSFYKDVMELTKFKLCVLNSSVAISTYAFYSTGFHLLADFLLFTGGTMCISMTTQVLNQILEKYHDKKMRRTCNRPLPKQRMSDKTAAMIGGSLWLSSVAFYSLTCPHAILFSNGILLLYIGPYTSLKRHSNLSMHIGAVVGGLPALLGSYAASGLILQESSLLLASYIYAWQYPHFYGILYQNKDDYKKAGFNFISNHSHKTHIAYFQMIAAMIAMLAIVYSLYRGKDKIMNTWCFITFLAFYIKNFVPVYKFISDPTKFSKSIRKESYMPFMIVLFAFMFKSYEMRKKTVKEEINTKN